MSTKRCFVQKIWEMKIRLRFDEENTWHLPNNMPMKSDGDFGIALLWPRNIQIQGFECIYEAESIIVSDDFNSREIIGFDSWKISFQIRIIHYSDVDIDHIKRLIYNGQSDLTSRRFDVLVFTEFSESQVVFFCGWENLVF